MTKSNDPSLKELKELLDEPEIDLSARQLAVVPSHLPELKKATKVDLSSNKLSVLPEKWLKGMVHLVSLDLGSNALTFLPDAFGDLVHLQRLVLYRNEIMELPLSFSKLRSLKHLDLSKNPLDPELQKVVGPCLSVEECKTAAKQAINFVKEKQRSHEQLLAQQQKHISKVQQVQQKHRDEKEVKNKKKKINNDANKVAKSSTDEKAGLHGDADKHRERADKSAKDMVQSARQRHVGSTMFSVLRKILRLSVLFVIVLLGAATVNILVNCANGGNRIAGSKPLCGDLARLSAFEKPSPNFGKNLQTTYVRVLTRYRTETQNQYKLFARSDIGKTFDKYFRLVHDKIVAGILSLKHVITEQAGNLNVWYNKEGHKYFGKALEGFKIGLQIVVEVVKDVYALAYEFVIAGIHRAEHFVLDFQKDGFSKAFERLIQH